MPKQNWYITIEGLDEVEELMDKLGPRLEQKLYLGFRRYVKTHLVNRIKKRLERASNPMDPSSIDPNTGVPSGGGGYGTPRNTPKYAEWKGTRINLPLVGSLSTRELVATGHLVESIGVLSEEKNGGFFTFTVGAQPGQRPSVTPFKNAKGFQEVNQADVERRIDNIELMQWIEDSEYAFMAKEYEDVMRDIVPLVLHLLKITLKELALEYGKK